MARIRRALRVLTGIENPIMTDLITQIVSTEQGVIYHLCHTDIGIGTLFLINGC